MADKIYEKMGKDGKIMRVEVDMLAGSMVFLITQDGKVNSYNMPHADLDMLAAGLNKIRMPMPEQDGAPIKGEAPNASQVFDAEYAAQKKARGENEEVEELGDYDPLTRKYIPSYRNVNDDIDLNAEVEE